MEEGKNKKIPLLLKDTVLSILILLIATILGYVFEKLRFSDSDIIMLYIIAVLIISILTSQIYYCLVSSIASVMMFNYLFTYPKFSLQAHDFGYPVTFVTMFITAFIAGTLANKLKRNIEIAAQNAKEKEEADALAETERFRANMLRAISHDLRTPLTSISGNASNLISNSLTLDEQSKQQIYSDIYDESMWLINLVENLLYSTRIENGKMNLNISTELLDDMINAAVSRIKNIQNIHPVVMKSSDEFLLVHADVRLIVQVIINILDNAIKYSPEGTPIEIQTYAKNSYAFVTIADLGNGIADEEKYKVFDMFYTGNTKIADSRRSLGVGLALCKSIVESHGGDITISDNSPCGTKVTFSLPIGEVELNEFLSGLSH